MDHWTTFEIAEAGLDRLDHLPFLSSNQKCQSTIGKPFMQNAYTTFITLFRAPYIFC